MRLRRILQNLLLLAVGLAVSLLLLETLFCKPLLPHLPKAAYHHMIRELRVLGQSSFAGARPSADYLAIVGDSNAQGKGDWFTQQGYDRTADFHSAHVLRNLLQRDVLSFGRSGAGSADGLLLEPLQIRAMLARYDMPLPRPSMVLAYFYEGNDVENNLDFLQHWIAPRLPQGSDYDMQNVEHALRSIVAEQATGEPRQWNDVPVCTNFMLRSLRNTLRNSFTRKYIDVEPVMPAGEVNVARIAGQDVPLPDRLQSPPLQVDEKEMSRAVLLTQASLALLAESFAPAPVVLVYVPAPLTCYELVSPEVSTYYAGETLSPAAAVSRTSNALFEQLAGAAQNLDLKLIDTRPALRKVAANHPIHGPRDWDHLNKLGYEALAEAIARGLD